MLVCAALAAGIALVILFTHRKRTTQTVADLQQLAHDHPDDAKIRLQLGAALSVQHRSREAEQEYEAAASLGPNDTRPLNALASIAIAQGNPGEAQEYLQASLRVRQDDAAVWRTYGMLLEKQNPTAAWHAYSQAISLDTSEGASWLRAGVQEMNRKNAKRGLHDMQRAAALNPDDLVTELELGAAARTTDAPTIAAQAFAKALSISPDSTAALLGSAASTLQVDPSPTGLARAAKQLEQVMAASPGAEAYIVRGRLYLMQRRYGAAVADLKTALKMDPTLYTAHSMLYQCYAATGAEHLARAERVAFIASVPASVKSPPIIQHFGPGH